MPSVPRLPVPSPAPLSDFPGSPSSFPPQALLLAWTILLLVGSSACTQRTPVPPATQLNTQSLVARLEKELSASPCSWDLAVALAEAYRTSDQLPKAMDVYSGLLSCGDPMAQGLAHNALAQLHSDSGELEKASESLWRSTSSGTPRTQSQAWFLFGELIRKHQTVPPQFLLPRDALPPLATADTTPMEAAEAAFTAAIDTGQPAPEVFRSLAELAMERQLPDQALEEYQIYLAGNPGDMDGWLIAAQLAFELGRLDHARFYLQMVLSKGSESQRKAAEGWLAKIP